MDDQPRQAANGSEHEYSLTVEEISDRYAAAGHPRTIRAIQRYCARGDLECLRVETTYGDRYMITPESAARHIAQIEERRQTTGRDVTRPVATVRATQEVENTTPKGSASEHDQPRPVATDGRYVNLLESENEFLRGQVTTKDAQIKELTERSRETNILIGGLQKMLSPLLGMRDSRQQNDSLHDIDATTP